MGPGPSGREPQGDTMLRIEINTDGAAFGEDEWERNAEIARILREIAEDVVECERTAGNWHDSNGNTVACVEWEDA